MLILAFLYFVIVILGDILGTSDKRIAVGTHNSFSYQVGSLLNELEEPPEDHYYSFSSARTALPFPVNYLIVGFDSEWKDTQSSYYHVVLSYALGSALPTGDETNTHYDSVMYGSINKPRQCKGHACLCLYEGMLGSNEEMKNNLISCTNFEYANLNIRFMTKNVEIVSREGIMTHSYETRPQPAYATHVPGIETPQYNPLVKKNSYRYLILQGDGYGVVKEYYLESILDLQEETVNIYIVASVSPEKLEKREYLVSKLAGLCSVTSVHGCKKQPYFKANWGEGYELQGPEYWIDSEGNGITDPTASCDGAFLCEDQGEQCEAICHSYCEPIGTNIGRIITDPCYCDGDLRFEGYCSCDVLTGARCVDAGVPAFSYNNTFIDFNQAFVQPGSNSFANADNIYPYNSETFTDCSFEFVDDSDEFLLDEEEICEKSSNPECHVVVFPDYVTYRPTRLRGSLNYPTGSAISICASRTDQFIILDQSIIDPALNKDGSFVIRYSTDYFPTCDSFSTFEDAELSFTDYEKFVCNAHPDCEHDPTLDVCKNA